MINIFSCYHYEISKFRPSAVHKSLQLYSIMVERTVKVLSSSLSFLIHWSQTAKHICFHRMMSSMRATPPFHPPSEEEEPIGQDNVAWAKDEQEGKKETASPSSHDQPHPDDLQPIREKPTDIEWENVGPAAMVRSELHTVLRNWPYLILRYVPITQIYKTNVVSVCTHLWHTAHKTHTGVHRVSKFSYIMMIMHNSVHTHLYTNTCTPSHTSGSLWPVCCRQCCRQPSEGSPLETYAPWFFSSPQPVFMCVCVSVCWGVRYLASGSVGP